MARNSREGTKEHIDINKTELIDDILQSIYKIEAIANLINNLYSIKNEPEIMEYGEVSIGIIIAEVEEAKYILEENYDVLIKGMNKNESHS